MILVQIFPANGRTKLHLSTDLVIPHKELLSLIIFDYIGNKNLT